MSEIYGYARVSTNNQDHRLQINALIEAGVPKKNIITETVSGGMKDKPKFTALLDRLQAGDHLVVWKVDRLGRNVQDALATAERLDQAGVRIIITTLGIDMKTPAGKLVFGLLAQIAAFERELIRERVTAGLKVAKSKGVALGRKHTLTVRQREAAAVMADNGQSLSQIAAVLGCSRSIVHRAISEARAATGG